NEKIAALNTLRRHAAKPLPRTVRKSVSMVRCSSTEDGWWPLGAPALPLAAFVLPLAALALPLAAWPLAEADVSDSWSSAREFAASCCVMGSNVPLSMQCAGQDVIVLLAIGGSEELRCISLL